MCGIAGVIKIHDPKDGPPPPPLEAIRERWLDILDESIKHRGPDGQGRFRDRAVREDGSVVDVALVHRRLSIIDHAGGHQPMVHDGDRLRPDLTYQPGEPPIVASEVEPDKPLVAVVFNGCIYNHRELRHELEGQGHKFETDHSDTEVLVHGWRAWDGPSIRRKLDGMHAHLSWVRSNAKLSTGTDEVGEKPLYLHSAHQKSLTVLSQVPESFPQLTATITPSEVVPDDEFSVQWITRGTSNTLPSLGDHIHPRGWHAIADDDNRLNIGSQLSLIPTRGSAHAFRDAEDVADELKRVISNRLEADVPLGVFLSGGIDSSIVAALAQNALGTPIRTYTVSMPMASYDESQQAAIIATTLGTDHRTLVCDANPADDLIDLIHTFGAPFGDSSLLPTYWVSRTASQEVKVALGGDGGDELFGGYRRHSIGLKVERALDRLPHAQRVHRAVWRALPSALFPARTPRGRWVDAQSLLEAYAFAGYSDLWNLFSRPQLRKLITSRWDNHEAEFYTCPDPLRDDYLSYLPLDILTKTDTASMLAPIELRSPFLARSMIERAFSTPLDVLMPNGERKGLLKQVARKYLPDHIVDRPKQGFAIPIGEWFRSDYGGMRQLLYDHLHSADPFPGLAESGVELNMKFVERMLKEHDAAGEKSINPWHGRDHSQRLYMLLVLSIWAKWLQQVRTGTEQSA